MTVTPLVDEDGEFHQFNLIVVAPSSQERHLRKQNELMNRTSSTHSKNNGENGDNGDIGDDIDHETNESNIDKDK